MATGIVERVRADAAMAHELHERSRALLVGAVRAGAAAGMSQREIAEAVGRSQPEVSRLLRFHGTSPLGRTLSANRRAVLEVAAAHGAADVRVFGSVARGTDGADSDIDLLVDTRGAISLFTLARLEDELTRLLGVSVDIVPAASLPEHVAERALDEAIPL